MLGHRYGFIAKSGVSVCEEEFNEARKRGLPILVFVEKCDLEQKQKEFFDRIGAYEDGYFIDHFKTPGELQTKVTKALFDYIGQPDVTALKSADATVHLAKYLPKQSHHHATSLGAVIFPSVQGETYLSPIDMEGLELRESLMQKALFGRSAILRPTIGTNTVDGTDHFGFVQGSRAGNLWRLSSSMLMGHLCGTHSSKTIVGAAFPSYASPSLKKARCRNDSNPLLRLPPPITRN